MARRIGGAEGFESNKKNRKQIKRAKEIRVIRKSILVACEGTKTERLYLEDIFTPLKYQHKIAAGSLVIAKHNHTDPKGVLKDLLDHPDYESFSYKWIVIDRDIERTKGAGHSANDFNAALAKAKSKGIEVAYSNPCFEIWYLLHLEYRNTAIDRTELQSKLEDEFNYQKNILFKHGTEKEAIANAKKLLSSYDSDDPANNNPSTNVHELITILRGFCLKN